MAPLAWTASWARKLQYTLCGFCIMIVANTGFAQALPAKIIGNDRGGLIGARVIEIAQINSYNRRIELRGKICYSSCTLYLGVDNLCLDPETIFGFHGPSRRGTRLAGAEFEHWSHVMAQHYNAPLREWFMRDARHTTGRIQRIRGAQLIALGYPAC